MKRFLPTLALLCVASFVPVAAQSGPAENCGGCALELDVRYLGVGVELIVDWGSSLSGSCSSFFDQAECAPLTGCVLSGVLVSVTNKSINNLWSSWGWPVGGGYEALWANGGSITTAPKVDDVDCGAACLWIAQEKKSPDAPFYASAWIKCGRCQFR